MSRLPIAAKKPKAVKKNGPMNKWLDSLIVKEAKLTPVIFPETEVKDMQVPEPQAGSPFQRKGMAECIVDDHERLTKNRIYRIEEFNEDGNEFFMIDDTGVLRFYPEKLFRAVDHGPFRLEDSVRVENVDGIVSSSGVPLSRDYEGSNFVVYKVDEGKTQCGYSGVIAWFPNSQIRLTKRTRYFDPNPFKKGESVKVVRAYPKRGISVGEVYDVAGVRGDSILLEGLSQDTAIYHVHFVKHHKKVKKVVKKKIHLVDHIRSIVNRNCYKKINAYEILKELRHNKIIDDSISVSDISKLTKVMFKW